MSQACIKCINVDLYLLPEVLTKEGFTLLKSKVKLKLAPNSLFRFITAAESYLPTFYITDNVLIVKGDFEGAMNLAVS